MLNIILLYKDLPPNINAVLVSSDEVDCYTILVNINKPPHVLRHSIAHEISHILEGHFTMDQHAGIIEALLHGNEPDFNHEEINFFSVYV